MKNWAIQDLDSNFTKEIDSIAQSAELSPQFTRVLLKRLARNYPHLLEKEIKKNKQEILDFIDAFLNPSLQKLLSPNFLPDLEKSAIRIAKAVENNEKILIWGDYDVDGITSSALCVDFFKKHNYEVEYHLPRREDGYGLNIPQLKNFIDKGLDLLITVDCGVSEHEAIDFANAHNIDCIITDHHILPDQLPNALSIVNPCICKENDDFDLKDVALCGVGVAFFLMCEVNNLLAKSGRQKQDMREFLDLVALGTIADMVPLRGLNRILVKNGLMKIADSKRLGVQALKEVSGYKLAKLSAGQVSFGLAPRINAAGRMDTPDIAIKMLLADNYQEALKLAKELDDWNSARKAEEEEMTQNAHEQARNYDNDFALVLQNEEWNQGIVGIVASRMLEKWYKPSFVLTQESNNRDVLKGSGRSTAEIDLYEALTHCKDDLLSFGGHKKAAGLTIAKDKVGSFRKNFNAYVAEKLDNKLPLPTLYIDDMLNFDKSADPIFMQEISLLEPFGINNAEPSFTTKNVRLQSLRYFGFNNKHLNVELLDTATQRSMRAKIWNVSDFPHKEGDLLEIVYSLELDNSSGMTQVAMKLKDFRALTD